jgi:hypothetical protein
MRQLTATMAPCFPLRPPRVAADVLVYSREDVERWGEQPGWALYSAPREGQVVHG